jgi:hypothetical protein
MDLNSPNRFYLQKLTDNNDNVFFLRIDFINKLLDVIDEKNKVELDDKDKFLNKVELNDEDKFLNLVKDIINLTKTINSSKKESSDELNCFPFAEKIYSKELTEKKSFCNKCYKWHFLMEKNSSIVKKTYAEAIENKSPQEAHHIIQVAGQYNLTMGGVQDGATRANVRQNIKYPANLNKNLYDLSKENYTKRINESYIMVHLDAEDKNNNKLGISYIVNLALDNNSNKEIEAYMLEQQYNAFFILSSIIHQLNKEKNVNIIPTSLGAGNYNNQHKNVISSFDKSKKKFSYLFKNPKSPKFSFFYYDSNSVISP